MATKQMPSLFCIFWHHLLHQLPVPGAWVVRSVSHCPRWAKLGLHNIFDVAACSSSSCQLAPLCRWHCHFVSLLSCPSSIPPHPLGIHYELVLYCCFFPCLFAITRSHMLLRPANCVSADHVGTVVVHLPSNWLLSWPIWPGFLLIFRSFLIVMIVVLGSWSANRFFITGRARTH